MSDTWPCHFVCGVVFLLVSMVLFCLFIVISFYVLRILGIGLGKEEVNGDQGELNETQQVM